MTKRDMKALVKTLDVQERALLFCLASGTDWKQVGVTYKTVAGMMGKLIIGRTSLVTMTSTGALALTDAGRVVLREMLAQGHNDWARRGPSPAIPIYKARPARTSAGCIPFEVPKPQAAPLACASPAVSNCARLICWSSAKREDRYREYLDREMARRTTEWFRDVRRVCARDAQLAAESR
jgi:hypothetical protein